MRHISSLLVLLLLILSACGGGSMESRRVGVDSSWYPLDFGNETNNVNAFSTELLTTIGHLEKIPFVKIGVNWNDLMEGLQKDKYEAILSSMPPYIFNETQFDFSDVYLPLGPVLVVTESSKIDSIDNLSGKEIAVISGSTSALILEKSPGVLIRYYDSIPTALNDILTQTINGALIDVLHAVSYCRDLYKGQLKIVTRPLNNEGLRLVSKHNAAPALIKGFNEGLRKMKKNGSYNTLLKKWGMQETIVKAFTSIQVPAMDVAQLEPAAE